MYYILCFKKITFYHCVWRAGHSHFAIFFPVICECFSKDINAVQRVPENSYGAQMYEHMFASIIQKDNYFLQTAAQRCKAQGLILHPYNYTLQRCVVSVSGKKVLSSNSSWTE